MRQFWFIFLLLVSLGSGFASAQDTTNPPTNHIWADEAASCTGTIVSNPTTSSGLNALLARPGSKEVTVKAGCKILVGKPASGSYGLVVQSNTTIRCEQDAGFVIPGKSCLTGTAIGAACTVNGDCPGSGTCGVGGLNGATTNAAASFAASGESNAILGAASGATNIKIVGCKFWGNQIDNFQRCKSTHSTDGGKPCEFRCSGNAKVSCDQDADCSGIGAGTCTNVANTCAPAGDNGTGSGNWCSDPPGRPVVGKVTPIDFTNASDVTIENVEYLDWLEAPDSALICNGTGSCTVDGLNTKKLSRPQCWLTGNTSCVNERPYSLDTDQTWYLTPAYLTQNGVKSTVSSGSATASSTIKRVTTEVTTGSAIYVTGGANHLIQNNTLVTTGSGGKGIYANGASTTVVDNRIEPTGASSIAIDYPANYLFAERNRIVLPATASNYGIKLQGISNIVQLNRITQSGAGIDNIGIADLSSNPWISASTFVGNIVNLYASRGNVAFYAWSQQSTYVSNIVQGGFIGLWSLIGNITVRGNRIAYNLGPKLIMQGGGSTEGDNYMAWQTGQNGEGICTAISGTGSGAIGNWCNTSDKATQCNSLGTCTRFANIHVGWPRCTDPLLKYGNGTGHVMLEGGVNHAFATPDTGTGYSDVIRVEDVFNRCGGTALNKFEYCATSSDCTCSVSADCGGCVTAADCGGGAATCVSNVCGGGGSMCDGTGHCRSSTITCAAQPHADLLIQNKRFLAGAKMVDFGPISSSAVSTVTDPIIRGNSVANSGANTFTSGITLPDPSKVTGKVYVQDNNFNEIPAPISSGLDWTKLFMSGNIGFVVSAIDDVTARTCTNRTGSIARGELVAITSGNDDSCARVATGTVATQPFGVVLGAFGNPAKASVAVAGVTDCSVISGLGIVAGDVLIPSWTGGGDVGKMTRRLSKLQPGVAVARATQSGTTVRCEVGYVPPSSPALPSQRLVIFDDFTNVTSTAIITSGTALGDPSNFATCMRAQTGASCDGIVDTNTSDTGLVTVDTGAASASGYAAIWIGATSGNNTLDRLIRFGSGEVYFRAKIGALNSLTGSGEQYCLASGLMDDVTAASLAVTDGVYAKACDGVNSQQWQLITCSNSVCTATNTSVSVAVNANSPGTVIELWVNAAGTSAELWINGVKAASTTSTIPTGVGSGGAARQTGIAPIAVRKTAGTAAQRGAVIDYYLVEQEYHTIR